MSEPSIGERPDPALPVSDASGASGGGAGGAGAADEHHGDAGGATAGHGEAAQGTATGHSGDAGGAAAGHGEEAQGTAAGHGGDTGGAAAEHGERAVPGTSPGVVVGAAAVASAQRAVAAQAGVKEVTEELAGGRVHQIEPDEHSPLAALANAISADFRRTLVASVLALAALGLTYISGGVLGTNNARIDFFAKHSGLGQVAAIVGAVFFLIFGVIAVRTATTEILKSVPQALGDNRRNGLRWVCLLVGYLVVIFGTLGALNVPIERLVVGGAVTGVILGIAAQQSLGNLFAGLMLLLTRPFAIGDEVSLRSGPLGGVLTGLIADMNLTYVKMVTDHGTILLPNSTVLTAVVGPPGVFDAGRQ